MGLVNFQPLKGYITEDVERFFMKYKSENTRKNYIGSVNKVIKDIFGIENYKYLTVDQLESLNLRVLTDYFNELSVEVNEKDEVKYKNSTLNRHMSVIKELIKFLNAWDVISYDVTKLESLVSFPDTREEHDMIPFDMAMKYIDKVSDEEKGLEKSLLIKLAIDTALRVEELVSIKWGNFTVTDNGVIMKSYGVNKGKGNKEWIDRIDINLYNELVQLKELGNTEYLFSLSYMQVYRMMERLNAEVNDSDKHYTFHSLKKLAVTMTYINNGNCIDSAMKKARHSNVTTTMRYLKLENTQITGIISSSMNTDKTLYKECTHEELIKALESMRPEFIMLLNNKIKSIDK